MRFKLVFFKVGHVKTSKLAGKFLELDSTHLNVASYEKPGSRRSLGQWEKVLCITVSLPTSLFYRVRQDDVSLKTPLELSSDPAPEGRKGPVWCAMP